MALTLNDIAIGKTARIKAVRGEGALRRRLLDLGFTPMTQVTVRKVAPLGDPLEISLRGYEITLRKSECSRIEIEEE